MKRRIFLRQAASALTVPVALHGLRFNALAQGSDLHHLFSTGEPTDRVLVIIQLEGGNDGLNTVIPVEDDLYYNARPTIAIPKNEALLLNGESQLRLHPNMRGMQEMFNDGLMAIVNNIGYNEYSLSHFAGTEIWNTGSGGTPDKRQATGWIARYLQEEFPDYPEMLPDHPPAIQIRPAASSIFSLENSTIGLALTDPIAFHELIHGAPVVDDDHTSNSLSGREWHYIRTVETQSIEFSNVIRDAAHKASNRVSYPPGNSLAESLAIVARLIAGGLSTPVYLVSLGNFDSHGNQLRSQGALLGWLSEAVKAFMDDLKALAIDHRVVGMTYSEFGRRIKENASGTDHGAASCHFVFGTPIDGGKIFGGLPDLAHPDEHGNLAHAMTFQCYYASVLGPLFKLSEQRLETVFPVGLCGKNEMTPLYGPTPINAPRSLPVMTALQNFPNPATTETVFRYDLSSRGYVRLILHSIDGKAIRTVVDEFQSEGMHVVRADLRGLPSGTYLYTLETGSATQSRTMTITQ